MKIVTWNMNKATRKRTASWEYLLRLEPDIALLQEVNSIPSQIDNSYEVLYEKATRKNGKPQFFGNAIIVKGKIIKRILLTSKYKGVNDELLNLNGNFLCADITLKDTSRFIVVSVHSPAWAISKQKFSPDEIQEIKLKNNKDVWGTELIWTSLKKHLLNTSQTWIVGGDFNASATFDLPRNRGNQEFFDRMKDIGIEDCLFNFNEDLVPTFRNATDKKVIHQMDHLFAMNELRKKIKHCSTGSIKDIFDNSLSDHLAIIAEFD